MGWEGGIKRVSTSASPMLYHSMSSSLGFSDSNFAMAHCKASSLATYLAGRVVMKKL